jgi:hypothetical protein
VVLAAAGTFFLLLSTACDLISPFCGGVTISLVVLSISKFDFSEPSLGFFYCPSMCTFKGYKVFAYKTDELSFNKFVGPDELN